MADPSTPRRPRFFVRPLRSPFQELDMSNHLRSSRAIDRMDRADVMSERANAQMGAELDVVSGLLKLIAFPINLILSVVSYPFRILLWRRRVARSVAGEPAH